MTIHVCWAGTCQVKQDTERLLAVEYLVKENTKKEEQQGWKILDRRRDETVVERKWKKCFAFTAGSRVLTDKTQAMIQVAESLFPNCF